jgi:integrase
MTGNPEKPPTNDTVKVVRRVLADGSSREYRYPRKARKDRPAVTGGALKDIFHRYTQSPDFKRLVPEWQKRKLWLFGLIEDDLAWMTNRDLENRVARTKFYELRDKYASLPHRADKMIQCLCSALSWAYDRGIIAVNHAHRMKPLITDPTPRANMIYTDEDESTLLAELPDDLRDLYQFAVLTCIRRGDLCRLTAEMIDKDGWLVFTPSKTSGTTKVSVHLPTFALPPLASLIERLPRSGALLRTATGREWTSYNLSQRWRRHMLALGFDGMHFHDVRGTGQTRMVEAGCTDAERASISGQVLAGGSGRAYVARTRQLALNAYQKLAAYLEKGAPVVPFSKGSSQAG